MSLTRCTRTLFTSTASSTLQASDPKLISSRVGNHAVESDLRKLGVKSRSLLLHMRRTYWPCSLLCNCMSLVCRLVPCRHALRSRADVGVKRRKTLKIASALMQRERRMRSGYSTDYCTREKFICAALGKEIPCAFIYTHACLYHVFTWTHGC